MKIVLNRCYGGYCLSKAAYDYLGISWDDYGFKYEDYSQRTDPKLIACVETLGDKASGSLAKLEVIEIPDDVDYQIQDYDGYETVEEKHRSW